MGTSRVRDPSRDDHPFAAPDRITVVSGLPRSGTSLLMQMLAAAGLVVAQDEARPADPDNPRGYFELAAARGIRRDAGFLDACVGRVVKIVAPLVLDLPTHHRYRVLFIERDVAEVLASQRAMLLRAGRAAPNGEEEASLARAYQGLLARCRAALEWTEETPTLIIGHRELLAKPGEVVERIARFLVASGAVSQAASAYSPDLASREGGRAGHSQPTLERVQAAMRSVVEPALYRSRGGS